MNLHEEQVLRAILDAWRVALRKGGISPHDNFYTLGGTSLAAAHVAASLNKALCINVSVGDVLRAPTAKALTWKILSSAGSNKPNEDSFAPEFHQSEPAPATVQQQAIWFLEQLNPGNRAYNTVAAIAFEGAVRTDLLERALNELIHRHPILRTTFSTSDGVLVQLVHDRPILNLDELKVGNIDNDSVEKILSELGRHFFDVRKLPLIRWTLMRLTPERSVLAQVEHHFVHDGWSMWILLTELAAVYRSLICGVKPGLPPLELDYETYGRWQRGWLRSKEAIRQRRRWTELLQSAPSVYRFPGEERRPPYFTSEGETVATQLPETVREHVAEAAAHLTVTPFTTLMAAFAVFLGAASSSDELTLGSMLRNRRLPGSERVVGMFVNTVALPIRGWRALPFNDFTRDFFAMLVEAQEREQIPFPVVVQELRLSLQLARNPLFQICFSMNDWPSRQLDFGPGLTTRVSLPGNGGAKFDLDVVLENPQQCSFLWRYYRPLFSRRDIVDIAAQYEGVLMQCLNNGSTPLGELMAR